MSVPTKKQIAAGQRRTLKAMTQKLLDMSAQWGDVDGYFEHILERLADKVQEASVQLTEVDE